MVVTVEFFLLLLLHLAFVVDPNHVIFDVSKMRLHLLDCLQGGKMTMFPIGHF